MNFDFNVDPDPAFHSNAEPNATTCVWILQDSILSLKASIVSVHSPQRLYFEPLKLLNFDLSVDPDLAFHSKTDPDPAPKKNADPDPQPWSMPV
jgi:hypothetical protein